MKKKELAEKVFELGISQPWNHLYYLADGVTTIPMSHRSKSAGLNTNKWRRIERTVGLDIFDRKNILDVGCSDGYFSLQVAGRAETVTGIDLDPIRIERAKFIKSQFKNKNCRFLTTDISGLTNEKFDLALVLGVLHRVSDPLDLLSSVADKCDELVIEYKCAKTSKPTAYFGGASKKLNDLNRLYFLFSPSCLGEILASYGFSVVLSERLSLFNRLRFPRHILFAKRITNP